MVPIIKVQIHGLILRGVQLTQVDGCLSEDPSDFKANKKMQNDALVLK